MFVYIRSAASIIVVTQKLVLQQPKNVTAKCTETLLPPSLYSILLGVDSVDCGPIGTNARKVNAVMYTLRTY